MRREWLTGAGDGEGRWRGPRNGPEGVEGGRVGLRFPGPDPAFLAIGYRRT